MCLQSTAQNNSKTYNIHTVAFYNVENLFDTIDDPNSKDEYSPILKLKTSKSDAYWSKINNIARVISEIGKETTKTSPTLIGLAEIENKAVLKDLIKTEHIKNQNYDYIHVDSPDWRGIDVALLYKKGSFEPINFKTFELFAFNDKGYRIKTRNQLLVTGYLDNELIHLIITHWPSQQRGQQKTEYLRVKSAELSAQIIEEVRNEFKRPKIILMGDLNENPTAEYLEETLKISANKEGVSDVSLYNPFKSHFKNGHSSLGFRDNLNMFDQILISQPFIAKEYNNYQFYKSGIFNPSYLTQKRGNYKGYPFRSWGQNNTFTGGYSDHYPVYIYLIKEQ
ncbi:endonuclease/exonuclease/phosphatase family protein [Urechidicola vernalis]|uniref:Endonuclease/exonuclease/phosphatase family protein n=1 Tax=Urechidicola vernalis TaxID=3075600 RepID=A0ABU2Y670_9FLAO|nr:endonuclease/exonuclease/phosphatase family protein [Urechidicola sp. P050]MDT0553698.1 endonuclease/exonuclease/phosphatase family protein [Urechidicola sp. P050]